MFNDILKKKKSQLSRNNSYCYVRDLIFRSISFSVNTKIHYSSVKKRRSNIKFYSLQVINDGNDTDQSVFSQTYSLYNELNLVATFSIYTSTNILKVIGKIASSVHKYRPDAVAALKDLIVLSKKLKTKNHAEVLLSSLQD